MRPIKNVSSWEVAKYKYFVTTLEKHAQYFSVYKCLKCKNSVRINSLIALVFVT